MYEPPVKDLLFVLCTQLKVARLADSAQFADFSTEVAESVLSEAARFATGVLEPLNRVGDKQGARWTPEGVKTVDGAAAAYRQFIADGWIQLNVPQSVGGQGAPLALATAADEVWFGANMAFMLCPMLSRAAIEALLLTGNPQLNQRFLPRMVTGEWAGTMNLTEPQAGSDLAAIRTRAAPAGDHYRLFGQKIFITYGDHDMADNIIQMVLARIDGAPPGVRGISLFVVPRTIPETGERNDVRCVSIEHKLGIHASPTCVMAYGDKQGAVGYLMGEPNRGLEYMFIMMNAARLSVGVQGIGLAERAFQQALEWARTRVQGGKLIIEHPDVRRMLLAMKSSTQAMRVLGLYVAMQHDIAKTLPAGEARAAALARAELLTPIIKGFCTEHTNTVASLAVQVHGGMGYVEETGVAQTLRDARITAIYEGTTGIQSNDLIGRKLLRDNGAALRSLIASLAADLGSPASDPPAVAAAAAAARTSLQTLQQTADGLFRTAAGGVPDALAVAVPFLMQCGFTIGGALLIQGAQIAARRLAAGTADAAQMRAKIEAANFFSTHWLPQAAALATTVDSGYAAVTGSTSELV
jgi:3-(methylthio)propanoyl-CoA dehydrogenase